MSAITSPSSALRVSPNPWRAFGGIWRLTYPRFLTPGQFLFFGGATLFLVLFILSVTQLHGVSQFYPWLVNFYLCFFLPVMSFLSGSAAIRETTKSSSTDYVLIRPVWRPAFVVSKFLSHVACLQVAYGIIFFGLIGAGVFRHAADLGSHWPLLLLAQLLSLTAFSALGFLFGIITNRSLIIGIVYAGTIEMGIGNIPTQLNLLSMTHQLKTMLTPVLEPVVRSSLFSTTTFSTTAILLAAATGMIAFCAAVFSIKELAEAPNRDA